MDELKTIAELKISDKWKRALAKCIKGATIPQICATIDYGYQTVSRQLQIYHAKGWLIRRMGDRNQTIYSLNREVLSP